MTIDKKRKTINISAAFIAVIFVALFILVWYIFVIPKPVNYSEQSTTNTEIWKAFEEGKNIGRNSIIIYFNETNQFKDNTYIDLKRLFIIEDSLNALIDEEAKLK